MDKYRKVCVYNIAANEIKFVDKWFSSMLEADYVTCLVTKNDDGTLEKMKEYEAKYPDKVRIEYQEIVPWRFDVARNESMRLIPDDAEILVSVDLDEYMEPGWANTLRENWTDSTRRCTYKYAWSHNPDGSPARVFRYNKIHNRGWIYKFPIHETLWDPIADTAEYSYKNSLELFDKIYLHHYPDLSKSRSSYLPLLELRKKENPSDYIGRIYLANEYVYRKKYLEAIHEYQEILTQYQDKYSQVEKASCYLFSGDCYTYLSDEANAIEQYKKAIEVDPTYREGYIGLAKVLLGQKRFSEAREILLEGIKNSYRHFSWLERDTSYSFEPWDLLCQACFYSGEKVESLAYAAKALSYCPADERLKQNFNICVQTEEKELV